MTRSRAILIISLGLILLILHVAGLSLEFYWRITWYDRVVHVLAGIVTVLAVFSLFFSFSVARRVINRSFVIFLSALVVSLVVGILWEVFELRAGITRWIDHGYFTDTTWDIICDGIGGLLGGWYLFLFG